MPRVESETRELAACRGDLHVELAVQLLAARGTRLQEPELLELAGETRVDACAFAQRSRANFVFVRVDCGDVPAAALLRRRRCELLADDVQRQKLVALETEDRLEPLDVFVAEHAIAALRSPRREQAAVLEVADLR